MAYHGSFRENLESAFWGLGLSYHNLMERMRVFEPVWLKCCTFDAPPQSELLITAHLERIWSHHFLALECHIKLDKAHASLQNAAFEMLQFSRLSPVGVAYHGSFRENLESAFWGLGLSYHKLIKHKQVSKAEQLKCCSFDASPSQSGLPRLI